MDEIKQAFPKRYLGDSVYASYDGYHIVLTTENGFPTDPSNRIALESQVLSELLKYRDEIIQIIKEINWWHHNKLAKEAEKNG